MSDGYVSGVSINSDDTVGSVTAMVSCNNQKPGGTMSGTVQLFSNGQLQKYKFWSTVPVSVKTVEGKTTPNIEASFKNVTLADLLTKISITNCIAFLTAT